MSFPRKRESQDDGGSFDEIPFATVIESAGRRLLAAVNPIAASAGLAPGMPLADALSFLPSLATVPAVPDSDMAALRRLAEWCGRYSPWTAPEGIDGIKIETTGSAHLWGGEAGLAGDLAARLARLGLTGRIAIADTLGTAWALARFGAAGKPAILASGDAGAALAPLPIEALRLDPATANGLRRVGLKRIGELRAMPRDLLARRFGEAVAHRLDQALGDLPEPLSPLGETPSRRVRLSFAEPIADPADLARAAERLAVDLVGRLAREGMGARRLDLAFHRVDGRVEHIRLGIARPSRDPHHIAKLLASQLETVDPGFGVEDMILAAFAVETLPPEQIGLVADAADPGDIAPVLDRIAARLGLAALSRFEPRESYMPERESVRVPVDQNRNETDGQKARRRRPPRRGQSRPVRLFDPPEPIEATWLVPDDPPLQFAWRRRRHRVARADGPERVAEEWWLAGGSGAADAIRDYYRVEDAEGRRFWLFRAGLAGYDRSPRWFVHGVFA